MSALSTTMSFRPNIIRKSLKFQNCQPRLQNLQLRSSRALSLRVRAETKEEVETSEDSESKTAGKSELNKAVTKAASTFAPRASGNTGKNPAYPGSVLYTVFEGQAYLGAVVGGLLAFNVLFPTDGPDLPRLLGMWSIWMFTVPSLRARDCSKDEKDALNYAFLLIPFTNVLLPLVWKSFAAVYSADVILLTGLFAWKDVVPFQAIPEQEATEVEESS